MDNTKAAKELMIVCIKELLQRKIKNKALKEMINEHL